MWIAFVTWTIFGGSSIRDKFTAIPGFAIGFLAAIVMLQFGNAFNINIFWISLSSLLGVFLVNGAIMYFANFEKFWIGNISAIFCGIFLTFSGIGQKVFPNTLQDAGIVLGVIMVYGILGLLCGYFTNFFSNLKRKSKQFSEIKKTE